MTIPNKPFRASDGHTEFGTSGPISLAAARAGMATPFRIGDLAGKSAEVTAGPPEVFENGGQWPGSGVCYYYSYNGSTVVVNGVVMSIGADNDAGKDNLIGSFTYNHLDTISLQNCNYWARRFSNDAIKLGNPVSSVVGTGQAIFPGSNGDICFYGDDRRLTKVSSDGHVIYNKQSEYTYARGAMFGGIIRGESTNLVNLGDPITAVMRPYLKPLKVSPTRPVDLELLSETSSTRVLKFVATQYCHFAFMAIPYAESVSGMPGSSFYNAANYGSLNVNINNGAIVLLDSFTNGYINAATGEVEANGPSFNIELFKGDVLIITQGSGYSTKPTYAAFVTELAL